MRTSKLNCFNEDQDWTNDEIRTILGCVMWQQSQSNLVCVISKKTVVATHENYDSAISSLIVQVICCVWLPVLGRSSTWPIKKKTILFLTVRDEAQPHMWRNFQMIFTNQNSNSQTVHVLASLCSRIATRPGKLKNLVQVARCVLPSAHYAAPAYSKSSLGLKYNFC